MAAERTAPVIDHLAARVGDGEHDPPAVFGVAVPLDQAALLERGERRAHRLRADPVLLGQVARGGGTALVQAFEGGRLGQRQFSGKVRLAHLPHQQPDGSLQGRCDFSFIQNGRG